MPNRNKLREVATHIRQVGHFDMETYGWETGCGAVGCVAGHVWWMENEADYIEWVKSRKAKWTTDAFSVGRRVLDLTEREATGLFTPGGSHIWITAHADKVPAALEWMADNETINWQKAAKAVGFEDMNVWWENKLDENPELWAGRDDR